MATISKTKTWAFLDQPLASDVNGNFDTLYAALTAGGQVSQLDGSQAFTGLDILPVSASTDDDYPTQDTAALKSSHMWRNMYETLGGTSCWLHAGAHAFPAVTSVYLYALSAAPLPIGASQSFDIGITAFPTDILTVVAEIGDTPGTGFQTGQLYIDRANSSLSSIRVVAGGVSVRMRFNLLLMGW